MTARREASAPPRLPGYEYLRVLGLGGFADVFLYQQELPRREVAVKVLLAGSLDDEVRARFQSEANLMAQLSHHPSIVTIYQAAIAADGRPYLVMEYCPRPNLQVRARKETFLVAEALRVGIQVAGAVETAHRAGRLQSRRHALGPLDAARCACASITSTASRLARSAASSWTASPPSSCAAASPRIAF